ncbi:Gelsolin y domain [Bonamia ostreae]|uniref:Gelsolin y domain n=1 Tax=Bonamia ostreae TaxID=126728 RepID=A0ABV2AJN6_9EUKA
MQNKSSKNEEKTDKNEEQSEKMNEEKSEKMNEYLKIEKCSKKEIKSIEEIEKEIEKADRIYSYEKLSKTADEVPPFIDYSKRESYLSDEEFEQIFKMQKAEFYKLTLWKQKILKKNVRLF